jgi:hypothetical protein
MPVLQTSKQIADIADLQLSKLLLKQLFEKQLRIRKPYTPRTTIPKVEVLRFINRLNSGGATKVGHVAGHRDQWFLYAYVSGDKVWMGFCQGRHTGRILQNGGFTLSFDIHDCEFPEELDMRHRYVVSHLEFRRTIIKEWHAMLEECIKENKGISEIRMLARSLAWAKYEPIVKGGKTIMPTEIEVLKEKVTIALKNGATPALKVCEDLRQSSPENATWLDQTYLDFKRPEMVGDDKDGLVAILKSSDFLRKSLENCKPSEIVHWMRKIKNIDPVREEEGDINLGPDKKGDANGQSASQV